MIRVIFISLIFFTQSFAQNGLSQEILAYWEEATRTVLEGDFEAYANSFHDEAILVNGISGSSYPIQQALDGWREGFESTKNGKMVAEVEFRFSERIHGNESAHESGIFRYFWQNEGEEAQEVYICFEALLTKSTGKWTMLMENQKAVATEEEWKELE